MSPASELTGWTATRIAEGVRKREVKAEEVARAFLDRTRSLDPKIRAFVTVLEAEALARLLSLATWAAALRR